MINTTGLVAVLDANVLYPAPVRDILLQLADVKLFQPKWTNLIHDEWIRNLLINRPDIKSKSLKKTLAAMESAFPDANVSSYESLIDGITLPDVDDRHVLAAAIKSEAKIIITNNLKDFPQKSLKSYHIVAQTADSFVKKLIILDDSRALNAFHAQVSNMINPPLSANQVLASLEKCGLTDSVAMLKSLLKI